MTRAGRYSQADRRQTAPRATPADWVEALATSLRMAAWAESDAGDAADFANGLILFRHRIRDMTADSFPSTSPVARLAAAAFLNAARAFAHADIGPETRTACAPMVREVARLTDRLLTLHQTQRAQSTWARGQFGSDD